jgi:hypothetical protein
MSKIIIPDHLTGKDLWKYLKENKSALIKQKKAVFKRFDPVTHSTMFITDSVQSATKAAGEDTKEDTGVLRVRVVANTSYWCDSQMDVLLPGAAKKSMKERKGMIPHLKNHDWTIEAELGDVVSIKYEDIPLKSLGLNREGTANCIVFETDILKEYDEVLYKRYKAGKVKQHSIGLFYVNLELAVNAPDDDFYEEEYKVWKKHIDKILNPEVPEQRGYFWVSSEFKLMENSAVLFGSNILTPTLEVDGESQKSTSMQPDESTEEKPQEKTVEPETPKGVDWGKIADRLTI